MIHTPPGEWHWHGATADRFMTHLAIWDGTGDPAVEETTWGEPVGDEDYQRARACQVVCVRRNPCLACLGVY